MSIKTAKTMKNGFGTEHRQGIDILSIIDA